MRAPFLTLIPEPAAIRGATAKRCLLANTDREVVYFEIECTAFNVEGIAGCTKAAVHCSCEMTAAKRMGAARTQQKLFILYFLHDNVVYNINGFERIPQSPTQNIRSERSILSGPVRVK
jgi:hypothetical protein